MKESAIKTFNKEKLLGLTIDSKFSFNGYMTYLFRQTSQ